MRCQKLQQVFEVQSFGLHTGPQSFCYSFITLSITRCSKSAQKFAARVRQAGLENIMIFSKISKYRKYQKYHDIFDILDIFQKMKSENFE